MIVFAEYDRWSGHRGTYFGDFDGLLVRFLVCGVVAVAIAWVSRRYCEEPFLRMRKKLAPWGGEGPGVVVATSDGGRDLLAV